MVKKEETPSVHLGFCGKERVEMEITLEMVDQVRERTCASYEEARDALVRANGNIVDAIIILEKEETSGAGDILERVKSAVKKGNVSRIRVLKGEEELLNIPVNAGIAGGVLGVLAGPWVMVSAVLAGVIAKYGFDCRFEVVENDGTVSEINVREEKEKEQSACEKTAEAVEPKAEGSAAEESAACCKEQAENPD